MTRPQPTFEIHESQRSGSLRLALTGELDHFAAPILEDRLTRLRARKSPVRLDLSNLEFIGSAGIRILVQAVGDARIRGWELQIEPDVSPNVMSVFRLVHLERFVGYSTSAHPSGSGPRHIDRRLGLGGNDRRPDPAGDEATPSDLITTF